MGEMDYTMSASDGFWMLAQIVIIISAFAFSIACIMQDKSKEKEKKGGV